MVSNLLGQMLGQYQLVEVIHQGENVVYKGFQAAANQYVAVKVLSESLVNAPTFRQYFEVELPKLSRLKHPNLLPILDYGQQNGIYFVVTPLQTGDALSRQITRQTPTSTIVPVIAGVAAGLDFLHGRGMVYGNLRPDNILLNAQGAPLLADLGYSQGIDMGGYDNAYISPELRAGGALTKQADIFALGALLYELLVGQPAPIDTAPTPRTLRPDLPEAVEMVILKAMSPDAGLRFQSAGELSAALNNAVPQNYAAQQLPVTPPAQASSGLHLSYWMMGGAILVIVLVALAFFSFFRSPSNNPAPPANGAPAITANTNVNIRSGPGLNYEVLGLLQSGQQAEALGRSPDQGWWAISFRAAPNGQGWVSADFVTPSNTNNLPIIQPPALPTPEEGPSTEPPVARISGPTAAQTGQTVTFEANGSSGQNPLTSYLWEMGDGSTQNTIRVDYAYNEAGIYDVRLTVTDNQGLSGATSTRIEISAPTSPPTTDLEGTTWRLQNNPVNAEITIQFSNGQVSGSSGCNTYQGSYQKSGNDLSIGPLAVTERACEAGDVMAQEAAYLEALQTVRGYRINGRELTLVGDVNLVYTPLP